VQPRHRPRDGSPTRPVRPSYRRVDLLVADRRPKGVHRLRAAKGGERSILVQRSFDEFLPAPVRPG
jgi:hypothetical protein